MYDDYTDTINRKQLKRLIEKGIKCKYSYTHYTPDGKPTDEQRVITQAEALSMLAERSTKRVDGYRFSPSRCFLYGYVRELIEPTTNNHYILFSEADRKPSVEEMKHGVR